MQVEECQKSEWWGDSERVGGKGSEHVCVDGRDGFKDRTRETQTALRNSSMEMRFMRMTCAKLPNN